MDLQVLIARSADVCFKPWNHSVVLLSADDATEFSIDDVSLRIECRDQEGLRHSDRDLELEIYRSGEEINLMLSWWDQPARPILWQGRHPVWMDGESGQRCAAPQDAAPLEALGRRLRTLIRPGDSQSDSDQSRYDLGSLDGLL